MDHDPLVARERALDELPTAYAVALRMRDTGADDDAIATALGLHATGVARLLSLAEAKLARLLDQDGAGST